MYNRPEEEGSNDGLGTHGLSFMLNIRRILSEYGQNRINETYNLGIGSSESKRGVKHLVHQSRFTATLQLPSDE